MLFRTSGLNFRRKRRKMKLSTAKSAAAWAVEILIVLLVAFVLVYCAGMRVTMVGNSMESTVSDGSQILVNRFIYNVKSPKSGDVIVFLPNGNEKSHYYVKRVIGVPGDVIDIVDDKVYLNGSDTPLDEPYLAEAMNQHETYHFEVPENCYFMMGDNRNYSLDARYWQNHYISRDKMVAKVFFEYFPTPKVIH